VYPKAPVLAIVVTSQCFPGGSEGGGKCVMDGNAELTGEDGPAFEPLRRICAVASGGFVSPVRSDGGCICPGCGAVRGRRGCRRRHGPGESGALQSFKRRAIGIKSFTLVGARHR
jgi:hypothetical protein